MEVIGKDVMQLPWTGKQEKQGRVKGEETSRWPTQDKGKENKKETAHNLVRNLL